jgi:hypothetical protein
MDSFRTDIAAAAADTEGVQFAVAMAAPVAAAAAAAAIRNCAISLRKQMTNVHTHAAVLGADAKARG